MRINLASWDSYWQQLVKQLQRIQFTGKYQQAFLEDLASLIEDGVPAGQAIDIMVNVSKGITRTVALSIANSLAKGQGVADGMASWFSHTIVEVIRVGEFSGTLPQTLRAAANMFIQYTTSLNAFLASVLYPLLVVALALGITVFIKNSVLNSFLAIKPIASWPTVGKVLYQTGATVEVGWWLIMLTVVFLVLIVSNLLKNVTGEVRRWLDDIPLLSLYRAVLAARFMETLGVLLANGVVLRQALTTMQYDATPYLSWHLLQMEYNLRGGQENIADVLDTNLISYSDLLRLRVVAIGKGFEHALMSLGRQARQQAAKRIERIGKIVGALLLMLGAGMAMTIVIGIYTIGSTLTF